MSRNIRGAPLFDEDYIYQYGYPLESLNNVNIDNKSGRQLLDEIIINIDTFINKINKHVEIINTESSKKLCVDLISLILSYDEDKHNADIQSQFSIFFKEPYNCNPNILQYVICHREYLLKLIYDTIKPQEHRYDSLIQDKNFIKVLSELPFNNFFWFTFLTNTLNNRIDETRLNIRFTLFIKYINNNNLIFNTNFEQYNKLLFELANTNNPILNHFLHKIFNQLLEKHRNNNNLQINIIISDDNVNDFNIALQEYNDAKNQPGAADP